MRPWPVLLALASACAPDAGDDAPDVDPTDTEVADDTEVAAPELGPIVRLTTSATDSQTFLNTGRCVAVTDDGAVHVAWLEIDEAAPFPGHARKGRILYRRSADGGDTWGEPREMTPQIPEVGTPKLAAAGHALFLVWHVSDGERSQIVLGSSDDGGTTWIPYPTPLGPGTYPSIDAWTDGQGAPRVHVAWSDSQATGVSEVWVTTSTDGAGHFAAPVRVSPDDGRSSWTGAVASWGDVVHVGWTDDRYNVDGDGEPYDCGTVGGGATCHEEELYRRSVDGGVTFEPEVRLTTDPADAPAYSWAPSLAAWHDDVHDAYFDAHTGRFQLYHRVSHDGGATWEPATSPTAALPSQPQGGWWRPSLAARGDRLRLASWRQEDLEVSTAWATTSEDGGATWSAPMALSEGDAALQPSVAMGPDGAAHFVWYDDVDGNQELYYRRLPAP